MPSARDRALFMAAMQEESRSLGKDMQNTSGAIGEPYPRMLYRATGEPVEHVISYKPDGSPREMIVTNKFNGLLCDTMVATDPDEAEALSADGWDTTPEAAHGMVSGLAAVTSAKDARIAELEAMLAAAESKRGPGRPRKETQEGIATDSEPA